MAGILTNLGETRMLSLIAAATSGYVTGDPVANKLKLFQNNVAETEAYTSTDLTEATFTGYAAVTLTGSSATVTAGAPSSIAWPQVTFTCSAATSQSIYGYHITSSTGILIAMEVFDDGPYVVTNNGDAIKVTPTITQD